MKIAVDRGTEVIALLFPLTYAAHMCEEFWGGEGFHRWIAHVVGLGLPSQAFWGFNIAYWLGMVAVVVLLLRGRAQWMMPAFATIVSINGAGHAIGTAVIGVYSPGLVTGSLLWIPLGAITLVREHGRIERSLWRAGIAAGIGIHALIGIIAAALVALERTNLTHG